MKQTVDVAIIGAGAAGLMAAIQAGRAAARSSPGRRIVALDGARSLGAKILVAGGGRCNVTHHHVDESSFAGSSPNAVRKVLRRFDVEQTVAFFRERGVELKREETGKLFPVDDKARTVLNALLGAAREAGVVIEHPCRVECVEKRGDRFHVVGEWGELAATKVILATGGKSLPKSGSDGHGYLIARSLGHSLTERIFPALVPLLFPVEHPLCSLSGVTLPATLEVRAGSGRKLNSFTDSTLLTHFGLSGPSALDISRYFLDARMCDPGAVLVANWLPGERFGSIEAMLQGGGGRGVARGLAARLPERLARVLCELAGVEPATPCHALRKQQRRALARMVTDMELPVIGDRGFRYAEVTAGGVPLRELHLKTMESRRCAGLHMCGEICDVDGRIGGFNFQWAWASGYVAGVSV
jgi:predicted Rossmann fold flavoprotein